MVILRNIYMHILKGFIKLFYVYSFIHICNNDCLKVVVNLGKTHVGMDTGGGTKRGEGWRNLYNYI